MRRAVVATVVGALVAAACSSSGSPSRSTAARPTATTAAATTTTSIVPAPSGLPAFYSFSTPLPTEPGTLVKRELVPAPGVRGTVYRVLYVSTDEAGKAVAVTGLVAVPKSAPPANGYPVVSWAHGTNGMADACAPSLDPSSDAALANLLLDKGWVVVATDYQGEGTPGLHPYIAGHTAARNAIDIVRAARQIAEVRAGRDYVVWGHSQGGQTAMFALTDAPAYAPELRLRGVVAGAPPSQFNLLYGFLKASPFKYYLLMAAGGLNAAYGDRKAPLDKILTPKGIALIATLDRGCAGDIARRLANIDVASVTRGDPFQVPEWRTILEANDPQRITQKSPVPLLIIHGGSDEQIPTVSSQVLAQHLCDIGQVLSRWVYPGQSHAGVIAPSAPDMVQWMQDRFAGTPNPNAQQPKGQPDVQVTRCS